MLEIFKAKPVLSKENTDFQIATYKWLLKNFGEKHFFEETKLILPTREFFHLKLKAKMRLQLRHLSSLKNMQEWMNGTVS